MYGFSLSLFNLRPRDRTLDDMGRHHRSPITLCRGSHSLVLGFFRISGIMNSDRCLLKGEVVLTISSVQTLRIQTLSLPSMPSTFSNSIPSHQHLLAGFLQNRRSFCAIPTALLLARVSLPLISVRKRASARLQMTALLGSPAR